MRCIYSGEPVLDDFSLDHFVPWSFGVHDWIWNLVPARKSANSRKGLRLPTDELVDRMCGMHLVAVRHAMDDPSFIKTTIAESYETDLRIDLLRASDDAFLAAQRDAIVPLVMQARRSGFPSGWKEPTKTVPALLLGQ